MQEKLNRFSGDRPPTQGSQNFAYFKQQFTQYYKDCKETMQRFQKQIQCLPISVLDNQSESHLLKLQSLQADIQKIIAKLDEIVFEVNKLTGLNTTEKQLIFRQKSQLAEVQADFQLQRKALKSQLNDQAIMSQLSSKQTTVSNRMKTLANEANGLDNTIALSSEILNQAALSSSQLSDQRKRLSNTHQTLSKLQTSSLPGAQRLISQITGAGYRNTLILAFVFAICLSITLSSMGAFNLIDAIVQPIQSAIQPQISSTVPQDSTQQLSNDMPQISNTVPKQPDEKFLSGENEIE